MLLEKSLAEKNPLHNYLYGFSTGPTIDTLETYGRVYWAENLNPVRICFETDRSTSYLFRICFGRFRYEISSAIPKPVLGAGPGVEPGRAEGLAWNPFHPAVVSEAGLEPAHSASLAQCLCQFGYTDKFGIPARIRTGKKTCLKRLRLPFRHEDIWYSIRENLVGVEGVEPSPRGPRPRILPLYDTPMNETGCIPIIRRTLKNNLFHVRILKLNRTVFGDLKGS